MTIDMNDDNMTSIAQLREFLKLSKRATFTSNDSDEAYKWIEQALGKFRYQSLKKGDRSIIKKYIVSMTGYSETHIDHLIARKKEFGCVRKKERTQTKFERIYTAADIELLAEVDNAEGRRNGKATKKTFLDMYRVHGDVRFERLLRISVAHIYNFRGTRQYESKSLVYTKTNPTSVDIGVRKKPQPDGKPGYIRVDSVHQGDLDKEKGVYHINLVDEVIQTEVVVTVEGISEYFLLPALERAIESFPFKIINFHSDNGSEYINKNVARLLQKLVIDQTKSRPRHTNDNPLAEGKNNFVIRRNYGYSHIPKHHAKEMDEFNQAYLNPYIFLHRQCAFPSEVVDERGKVKKVYKDYMTPCEKLLSIENVEQYLKEGVTRESLKAWTMKQTHLAAAQEMQQKKKKLFANFRQKS